MNSLGNENEKKSQTIILFSNKNRKRTKFEKGHNLRLPITWIDKRHLLWLYPRHFIWKDGTTFKSKWLSVRLRTKWLWVRVLLQFFYISSPSGLSCYGSVILLFIRQGPHADFIFYKFWVLCFFQWSCVYQILWRRAKKWLDIRGKQTNSNHMYHLEDTSENLTYVWFGR